MTLEDLYTIYSERICRCLDDRTSSREGILLQARKEVVSYMKDMDMKGHDIMFHMSKFKQRALDEINFNM